MFKLLSKPLKFFAALLLVAGLAACEAPEPQGPSQKLQAGTLATYKISGHIYKGEITHASEGYSAWEFSWKNSPVFKFKTYRGLLSVYNEEEEVKTWSKFDSAMIDTLFPLDVGKEVTIEGRHFTNRNQEGYPFYVTITVRREATIKVKEQDFPVFIIDFSVIEDNPEGEKTFTKTQWYSEELELAIRTDYQWEDRTFSMRLVALEALEDREEEEGNPPEGLGTVRL
jgi:hypothetical protein